MAIFKAVVQHKYAQIPNSTLQDSSISFEARGLLAMMLSMPPDWEVNKAWVINQSKAGKDKVNSIFKELIGAGYIRKCESQRQRGKFASDDYFVFPEPERICRSGQTVDGKTDNGESATTKETVKQKKQDNKETSYTPSTDGACKGYQEPQPPAKPEKPKKHKYQPEHMQFAEQMYQRLLQSNPNHKKPNLEAWANTIRLTVESDNRLITDLWAVFDWANRDDFWSSNILSPDKLRKQFDTLIHRINKNATANQSNWQTQSGWSAGCESELHRGDK